MAGRGGVNTAASAGSQTDGGPSGATTPWCTSGGVAPNAFGLAPRAATGSGRIASIMKTVVAYIICEPCIGTKDTACVDVCPVDCIHPRKDEADFATADMLYIHPDECIDCGACVPACPVEAIFALDETPQKWNAFIPKNADYYQR
jgi:ferredoxin